MAGDPVSDRVWIRRSDGKPLVVREAVSTRPGVEVEVEQVSAASPPPGSGRAGGAGTGGGPRPGDWLITVRVPEESGARTEAGELRIATDDPEQPRLDLPLRVRIRPRFQVLPPRLTLRRPAGAAPFTARITVRHGAGKRFRVVSAKLEPPLAGVSIAVPGHEERRSAQVVEFHATPGPRVRHETSTLHLVVRDKGHEQTFSVPVSLEITAAHSSIGDATVSQARSVN